MPLPLPQNPPRRWRPEVARGVFETVLVLDGRPVERGAHLARLESSLAALFPGRRPPPLDVPPESGHHGHLTGGTSSVRPMALRIAVAPGPEGELEARFEWREPTGAGVVSIGSVRVPGGLGPHKWADRRLLEAAQARLDQAVPPGGETLPLIVDSDGAVLEASRANVFAVRDGALLTPPLDGRILPGVTRARVMRIAAAEGISTHERTLRRDDLLAAEEVFLTGSVRGIEPVRALDGTRLDSRGDVTHNLATGLRRAWLAGATEGPALSARTARSGG